METKEIFKNRLTQLRKEKGVTRQIAADNLEISRASLEYYEKGLRNPDICVLARIAEYYNVSADYLIGLSDVKSIDPKKQLNIACEYTGLSEESITELHAISFEHLFKLSSDIIEKLIINLIRKKNFHSKVAGAVLDIYRTGKPDLSEQDYGELLALAFKHGYCLFGADEITEYWKTMLSSILYSAVNEALEEAFNAYFNEE